MKNLPLSVPAYELLQAAFREWIDTLGYCEGTVEMMPNVIREFLHHLEQQGVKAIHELKQKHIKAYYNYVSTRGNQRRGGGLSNSYLNHHLQALEKFLEYLHHRGMEIVPTLGIKLEKIQRAPITPLTVEEVRELFNTTHRDNEDPKAEAISARDRIMLVAFYSCGLRRKEAAGLEVDDINLDTRIVHVRKGKGYKERFVPLNKTNAQYVQQYVYDHRPLLVKSKTESALFISKTGKAMTCGALYSRLRLLIIDTGNLEMQQKTVS